MKQKLLFILLFVVAGMKVNAAAEYVDLALPSGTLWATSNESGSYMFYEAVAIYENYLPTTQQYEELIQYCKMEGYNGGVRFRGANGKSITIPDGTYIAWGNRKNAACVHSFPFNGGYRSYAYSQSYGKDVLARIRLVQPQSYAYRDKLPNPQIDLGLSNKMKWKAMNEKGRYRYDEMKSKYSIDSIPTKKEWQVLYQECIWEWIGYGYRLKNKKGENNHSLYIPVYTYDAVQRRKQSNGSYLLGTGYWINPYRETQMSMVNCNEDDRDGVKMRNGFTSSHDVQESVRLGNANELIMFRRDKEYLDMGLPSRTKWASYSERYGVTWNEAMSKYGSQLPSKQQYEELFNYCTAEYYPNYFDPLNGYVTLTSDNGNKIALSYYFLWTKDYQDSPTIGSWILYSDGINKKSYLKLDGRGDKIGVHLVR